MTYAGQVVASGLGFALQLFLQKQMGPADYGVLGLAVSIGSLSGVLTDLGLSHAMVRFGSKYLSEDPTRARASFAATLLLRLALNLIVTTVGYLSAYFLAVQVFEEPELAQPLRLVFLVIAGQVLFSYWVFFIQTLQRFGTRSVVMVVTSLVRIGLFAAVFVWLTLTPTTAVLADATASFLGFLIGMAVSPRGWLRSNSDEVQKAATELLPYCRFTGVLIVGNLLFNELDTLMLGMFADKEVVGLYRAAWNYAMVLGFLNQSVANVLFPKITAISTAPELTAFAWKTFKLTSGLAVVTLPAPIFLTWWIPWYEPQYAGAVVIFYIMYAGLVVDLVFGPLSFLLFSMDRPNVVAWVAVAKIIANVLANLLLIPPFGAVGAAFATLVTRFLGGGLILLVAIRVLRKGDSSADPRDDP